MDWRGARGSVAIAMIVVIAAACAASPASPSPTMQGSAVKSDDDFDAFLLLADEVLRTVAFP